MINASARGAPSGGVPSPGDGINQAIALHREGQLSDAERLYKEIIAADPNNFEAIRHLSVLLLQLNDAENAVELIRRAIALNSNSAEACSDLATALNILRRHDEAISSYEDSLAIDPNRAETYYGLASALHSLGRVDEAISCFQRALSIDPDYIEAYCGLAESQRLTKRHADAILSYQKALAIEPAFAEAHFDLATCLQEFKKFDEAIVHFRRALSLKPNYSDAYNGLGVALDAQGQADEALFCFEQALKIRPEYAEAHANRGIALRALGDFALARLAFECACDLEPRRPSHYFGLANCSTVRASDPKLAAMATLALDLASLTEAEQIQLHFALGKALSDVGDYDKCFDHLRLGNSLKRKHTFYDEKSTLTLFDCIREVFTPRLMRERHGTGHSSDVPVFIVGMPRSGSTLVEQILASHPSIFGAGERDDFRSALRKCGGDSAASPFPSSVAKLSDEQLSGLGGSYLAQIEMVAASAREVRGGGVTTILKRITDKTLMHFTLLGLIKLALPNAHIIHIQRNPIDTCLSCYSKLFDDDLPFTYDLGELGRYYLGYRKLMEHWSNVLPEGWILNVQYEALVKDFEEQARRIVAHCGVAWNDSCLDFHKVQRVIRTASATQVRQPIYQSSIERRRPDKILLSELLTGLGISGP